MKATTRRGYHDIGGRPAGPIERRELPFEDWQKQSEALRGILEAKGRIVSLDEIRRVFETFGQDLYNSLGFYERRAEALTLLLVEKGIITSEAIRTRMDEIAAARGLGVDYQRRALYSKAT
ncbi:MAG: nitrile hydratase subunit beta [Methylobacteriaceae bacterium]|nr:nitrile hydratase subunit beta [Methylobacteriaceae bacterium]